MGLCRPSLDSLAVFVVTSLRRKISTGTVADDGVGRVSRHVTVAEGRGVASRLGDTLGSKEER
jgi:hypothetical protein